MRQKPRTLDTAAGSNWQVFRLELNPPRTSAADTTSNGNAHSADGASESLEPQTDLDLG
jgi:hypothetical protein